MIKALNRRMKRSQIAWSRCVCEAEALEQRVFLNSYTVTNTNDLGTGSLRQAILDADSRGLQHDRIRARRFPLSPHTITFTSATPQINGN